MARISKGKVSHLFKRGDESESPNIKGKTLEELFKYLFEKIPGVTLQSSNQKTDDGAEEIDLAFWNRKLRNGLYFLGNLLLVECKNWSRTLGSSEVSWFDHKLRTRGLDFGILVAANGISGNSDGIQAAKNIVLQALSEGRQMVIISRSDIESFSDSEAVIKLLQQRICELIVNKVLS